MGRDNEQELDTLAGRLRNGNADERAESAKALGLLGDPGAEKYLVKSLEDEDETVRSNSALALGQIGCNASILTETLSDDSWQVRHDGVIAFGRVASREHMDKVIPLTKDQVKEVREQAIRTLARIGGIRALPAVLDYMADAGPVPEVAEALDMVHSPETVKPLTELYHQGDQHVREIVVKALGRYRTGEAVDTLITALGDGSWRIREEAAAALGDFQDERILSHLVKRLSDDNSYVVEKTLKSIGKLGDERVVERIKKMLEHEDASVRAAASEALGMIGGEAAVETLLSMLHAERNPMVVWSVADALGAAARGTKTPRIGKEMKNAPDDHACVLAVALGNAGDPDSVDILLKGMVHPSWKFRQKSVEAITKVDLTGSSETRLKRVVKSLEKALSDPDRWVRVSAAKTLGDMATRDHLEGHRDHMLKILAARSKKESDQDVLAALKDSISR